ncbi:MAG: phage baseplate upper protein [Eubacteriales bacterium]|nr:phage baseplate upper protein [Eubacteriales bacterium]
MQTKDYTITLDMMRTLPFRPFEVVEGDTGNVLHVTLLNNGDPMPLDGCKINIAFASSSGFAMQDETSGIVKKAASGTIDITLLPTAYGAGNVCADVQIYSGEEDGTLITSTRFDFRCRKSLISGDIIRANMAYPPLVEAARSANDAAKAALAAAARIDTDIGELNVQADWNEQDTAMDAYIRNKPTIPIVAGNVGAPLTHASRHASGGDDPVTPASILAAGKSVLATVTLDKDNWTNDTYTLTGSDVAALSAVTTMTAWEILPGLTATDAEIEALQEANLLDGGQSAGSITVRAKNGAPTIDVPVRIIVRGDLYA